MATNKCKIGGNYVGYLLCLCRQQTNLASGPGTQAQRMQHNLNDINNCAARKIQPRRAIYASNDKSQKRAKRLTGTDRNTESHIDSRYLKTKAFLLSFVEAKWLISIMSFNLTGLSPCLHAVMLLAYYV